MYSEPALLISGKRLMGGGVRPVINPATEEAVGECPVATEPDLAAALEAAQRGFQQWSRMSSYDRAKILRRGAELIRERLERIATTLTLEQGKPLAESRIEVGFAADVIEWYAEEGRRTYGRIIPARAPGSRFLVVQEPIGPAAAFTPWNFPALTPARKIGGALGAGCSLIIKPAEETPGTCVELVMAMLDAGVPPDALHLVTGVPDQISRRLIQDPVIRKFSFTGSIPVGKQLLHLAADGVKRSTMELGGHGPVVVFDDVDAAATAQICAAGKYRNAGQVCVSPTRFYVQEGIYGAFTDSFAKAAKSLRVGNGLDPDTQMGPVANPRRRDAMDRFVADAKQHGGRVIAGGERMGNRGYFYQPTAIADLPDDALAMREEPFGPLALIVPFKTPEEAIQRANSLEFGLAAYAFTTSEKRAAAVSSGLKSGMVGVNSFLVSFPETPFGGVKESGFGQEGGTEGLESYLDRKLIHMA